MRVLVTGEARFIGSHLVDPPVSRGHVVTVIDNLDPKVQGPGASKPRHVAERLFGGRGRVHSRRHDGPRGLRESQGTEALVDLAAGSM
jgi:nucleoside-diphosphate-sugar epimerase